MVDENEGVRQLNDGNRDSIVTRAEIRDLELQMDVRFRGIQQ